MRQSLRLVSGLYLKLSLLTIAVGFLLRIVLLFNEQTTDLGFSFGEWLQVFLLGAVNDLCAATIGFAFLWLDVYKRQGCPQCSGYGHFRTKSRF